MDGVTAPLGRFGYEQVTDEPVTSVASSDTGTEDDTCRSSGLRMEVTQAQSLPLSLPCSQQTEL